MLIRFLAGCILILCPVSLAAQYKTTVHSISHREGLSNGAVNTIAQDPEGYIWFGTWNGLNRYDGKGIVTYLPGSSSNSIHNHVIRELYPSSQGTMWMLTNKGIGLYDNLHDRFSAFFTRESEQVNNENDIAVSHSDELGTLASVYGLGLFKFLPEDQVFEPVALDSDYQEASLSIKRIHQIAGAAYLITGGSRLLLLEKSQLHELLHLPITGTLSSSIAVVDNQKAYILITQRAGTALLVDILNRTVRPLDLPNDIITTFARSKEPNLIWVGTEKGMVYRYNLTDYQFETPEVLSDELLRNPITTRILSIQEADPDLLLIGTDGSGVFTVKLTRFPGTGLSSEQLAYPIVRSILVTHSGELLIGTKGGGIDVFSGDGRHLRNLSVEDGLSNNSVLSVHEDGRGYIWVGSDGPGVDVIDPDYSTIRNFPRDYPCPEAPSFSSVYRILRSRDEQIYLGTSGYGVFSVTLDPRSGLPISCEQLILDKSITEAGQQKQIVYSLAEEKPGRIWIGTRGNGIIRFNTITKRVMGQYTASTHPGLIRNDDILSLLTDPLGRVWVGSSNGLFGVMPLGPDSVGQALLPVQQELENASIHGIQCDRMGNLWVTTNQGLSLVDLSAHNVRSFNVNDGLINFEYSDGATYYDFPAGRLYVGGTMGVDIIQTEDISFSSYYPPIAVNGMSIRNQPVSIGDQSVLSVSINQQSKLDLRYNQNFLSFEVLPVAFWGRERYRIAYRLVNFDEEWIVNPPDQRISYSNLKPGNYTLQLKVSDENGAWSPAIRELGLTLNPPFWLTTWAIIGYVLLLTGIQVWGFSSYRRREARKKEAALVAYKQQKEEELQNYKLEFFTNVAHELRTPLTLITAHIHALLEDPRNIQATPRLVKVFNNSVRLQKLVLEIMQFRKLEKGKEPLNIQQVNPVELTRDVLSDLDLLAQQRQIRCEIQAPDPELRFNTDADKFQRILTNLISNAIKYNQVGGHVRVTVEKPANNLIVRIEDSGIGIRSEFLSQIFEPFGIPSVHKTHAFPGYRSTGLGLAVTKGLVELMKGSIQLESQLGEGSTFTCTFPGLFMINRADSTAEPVIQPAETGNLVESLEADALHNLEIAETKPLILLVDDDPELLDILRDILKEEYSIITAGDGKEACERILTDKPDLIVADVMMPEMDGIELCSSIRSNFDTSHLPVILLTAKAETEDRIAGLKAGADSYIPKPFHPEHLKVRIAQLLLMRAGIMARFGKYDDNPALVKEIPDPFFQKLLNYIDENLDDETLSAEKLCERLAISKSSLYNKTRSVLGTTPHGLINHRRLSKATALLASTMMTVSEIIDHTGFASRTHFYDLFSKSYGCSPSDYRNQANHKPRS